ncbi:hypothetical protein CDD83_8555 [Cordyceps sp. RAO-2017]|nr:hypothetical protein CDD83_8555 [Cordyceps sp. RAO-2017]
MSRQRPHLRNGVDLQLQSAFHDGNWPVAMRLAEKRARTFQDQYFEIVKICAESQLDDPSAKFAAVAAVERFVKQGTVVKDVDAIDLLEWAVLDLLSDDDFADTLGPLRVRAVKALPKDKIATTRCLESCLLHWDLVSAQQIAAIIDKSFPAERSFLFWNIVITHMLALSTQSPPEKKKLYGMLALKQIERAAQLTEQTEQEVLLLYRVVETHGAEADFKKLLASPVFSPVSQFRLGRKEPLFQALANCHRRGDWATIFDFCFDCLSDADENDEPTLLACDWLIWNRLIEAASHLMSVKPDAKKSVQALLLAIAKSKNLRPIYRRNVLLARVLAAFHLGPGDQEDLQDGKPSSLRLRELVSFIDDQKTSPACFDDIKRFMEMLSAPAIKFVAYRHVPQLVDAAAKKETKAQIRLLSLMLQYFVSTCSLSAVRVPGERPTSKCVVCDAAFDASSCPSCLSSIGNKALDLYTQSAEEDVSNPIFKNEVLPGLALTVALCNLGTAFNVDRPGSTPSGLSSTKPLLRALFMLEHQLHLSPKHAPISLVLVQLHLMLGSAYRAREIWDDLSVKRTIVDSLAPIFYDRLSTLAPTVLSPSDSWGNYLMDTLKSHYSTSLKLRMPRRLIDAFEAGSYCSVMEIPKYIENLRAGCTRALSLVEESRTHRLLGVTPRGVLTDDRLVEMTDEVHLFEVIDYGSFPSWQCSTFPPLYTRLRIGPPPSNERMHLALLAEAFYDVLDSRPPSTYKGSPAVGGTDQVFVLEMMARLAHSFSKFLGGGGSKCTRAEMLHFETVSLLCVLIPLCTGLARTSPVPEALGHITESLRMALESLKAGLSDERGGEIEKVTGTLKSLHRVTMLRDSAMAVKLAARWILELNEREKERDRSGSSNLSKEVVSQVKALQAAAQAALEDGKGLIKGLRSGQVTEQSFVARLRAWVFDEGDALGTVIENGTISELVDSWQSSVGNWQQVRWE